MLRVALNRKMGTSRLWTMVVAFGVVIPLVACNTSKPPAPSEAGPKTFATPDDAGAALLAAAKADDRNALLAIFGSDSADLIFSGDAAQDKQTVETLHKRISNHESLAQTDRWQRGSRGGGGQQSLSPFRSRRTAEGSGTSIRWPVREEILARRIGDNELATIDVMNAMADAQAQYLAQHHDGVKQYAQKFISDEGKQNGLYWKSAEGQPRSPLGPLVAYASTEGFTPQAGKQQPFHGYFYRVLTKQGADAKGGAKDYIVNGKMTGGFAFIAYPEKYGDTGITTFIIDQSGVVYEKDLGKSTTEMQCSDRIQS